MKSSLNSQKISFLWTFIKFYLYKITDKTVCYKLSIPYNYLPCFVSYFLSDSQDKDHRKHVQFSSVTQSCLTLCDSMNRSTPGLPVHQQLQESTQTHVHQVSDAIQPSHPLSSPSPPALNPSHHQSLFQWVSSLHEVAKVLEFQLQHQVLPMNTQDWSPLRWTKELF